MIVLKIEGTLQDIYLMSQHYITLCLSLSNLLSNYELVDDDFTQFHEFGRPPSCNDITVFHELFFYLLRALIGCLRRWIREFRFRPIYV